MKKIGPLVLLLFPIVTFAQFESFSEQSDLDVFRKEIERKFRDYQDTIDQRFIKELAHQWEEYEVFQGNERPQKPKPTEPIIAPKDTTPKPNSELPVGVVVQPIDVVPSSIFPQGFSELENEPRTLNAQGDNLIEEYQPNFEEPYNVSIDLYQQPLTLFLPAAYSELSMIDISEQSVAELWKQFSRYDVSGFVSQIEIFRQKYNYNDWAVYEMIHGFACTAFPQQIDVQTVFSVFLLNHLGMDVQVGRKSNHLMVLLSSNTTIYAVPYIKQNEVYYYMFNCYPEDKSPQSKIYTYNVKYSNKLRPLDLHIEKPIRFPYTSSNITYKTDYWSNKGENPVSLNVNQNVIDFYARYPQVDITVYATAQMTQELMDWAKMQVAPVLSKVKPEIAVTFLLDYIQNSFSYSTDEEQFGCEKTFFCEENFYYEKNDCEDRAILLSYFVRNFVDADIVLLDYPEHIATAICFPENSEVIGDHFLLNGKKYFVCDPTYIGAGIGESMPMYKNVKPDIIVLKK